MDSGENGAVRLVEAAKSLGVDTCFANPGTTEIGIVDALDRVGGVRSVLGLFEGVVAGAADGYGRIARKPALTLVHLGPGLANAIANLHNARRARTPLLNLVGEHAKSHRLVDSPLHSDIESMAWTVSAWVRAVEDESNASADMAEAVRACSGPPGAIATLVVPMDVQWSVTNAAPVEIPPTEGPIPQLEDSDIESAARRLCALPAPILILGGDALCERGLRAASRVRDRTGCGVLVETFPARIERGRHLPWFKPVPYFPERAKQLMGASDVVLAGAALPVNMFADREGSSRPLADDVRSWSLGPPGCDIASALEAVGDLLGDAPRSFRDERKPRAIDRDLLDPGSLGGVLCATLPDGAVVVDEGGTSSYGYVGASRFASPHTAIGLTGGAIGSGLPMAVGAAIASPGKRVVALQADGSGMYTNQALWTMAREDLDITVIVLANRRYAILHTELDRAGIEPRGTAAESLTSLARPDIDWVQLAEALGVPGRHTTTVDGFERALADSFATPGPSLLEVRL